MTILSHGHSSLRRLGLCFALGLVLIVGLGLLAALGGVLHLLLRLNRRQEVGVVIHGVHEIPGAGDGAPHFHRDFVLRRESFQGTCFSGYIYF